MDGPHSERIDQRKFACTATSCGLVCADTHTDSKVRIPLLRNFVEGVVCFDDSKSYNIMLVVAVPVGGAENAGEIRDAKLFR